MRQGSLPKEVIRRVVRKHRREVLYCYQRELEKDGTLEGRLLVSFTISPAGSTKAIESGILVSFIQNERGRLSG